MERDYNRRWTRPWKGIALASIKQGADVIVTGTQAIGHLAEAIASGKAMLGESSDRIINIIVL